MSTIPIPSSLLNTLLGKQPVQDAITAAGSDLLGAAQSIPKMLIPPLADASSAINEFRNLRTGQPSPERQQYEAETAAGYSLPYRAIAPLASGLGANVSGMEESARQGSPGGVLGHAAVPLALTAAGEGLGHLSESPHVTPSLPEAPTPLYGEHPVVAQQALTEHAATGGSTFDPRTGANLSGTKKWSVGVAPETSAFFDRPISGEQYSNFVSQHRDILSQHPHSAVGTSFDPETGLHQMEIVGMTSSKTAAGQLANSLGEGSIYHLGRDESVPISTGERPINPLSISDRLTKLAADSPKPAPYSGTHFSDAKLDTIEGARRGLPTATGVPTGVESARLKLGSQTGLGPDAPPGFYTYRSGTLPEPSIGARKTAYPVRGHFSFGSPESPEFQQAYHEVSTNALDQGADMPTAHGLGLNAGEHALRDAGYDGYSSPDHPNTQFIFDDHTPRTYEKPKIDVSKYKVSDPSLTGLESNLRSQYGKMSEKYPVKPIEPIRDPFAAPERSEPFAEWPAEYRNGPQQLSRGAGAGANYSGADLESFKAKHGIK